MVTLLHPGLLVCTPNNSLKCRYKPMCQVYERLAEAQQAYLDVLDSQTIESIGAEFSRHEDRKRAAADR